MNLIWRPDAYHDLRLIQDDIGRWDLQAAGDLLDRVEFYAERLPDHHALHGVSRRVGTHEVLVHPNYVMIYRSRPDAVEVVNIMHSRLQYPGDGG